MCHLCNWISYQINNHYQNQWASCSGHWLKILLLNKWTSVPYCLKVLAMWYTVFLRTRDPRERKINISRSCHKTSDVTFSHSLVHYQGLVYPELQGTTLLYETYQVRVTEATSLHGWWLEIFSLLSRQLQTCKYLGVYPGIAVVIWNQIGGQWENKELSWGTICLVLTLPYVCGPRDGQTGGAGQLSMSYHTEELFQLWSRS